MFLEITDMVMQSEKENQRCSCIYLKTIKFRLDVGYCRQSFKVVMRHINCIRA